MNYKCYLLKKVNVPPVELEVDVAETLSAGVYRKETLVLEFDNDLLLYGASVNDDGSIFASNIFTV